MTSDTTQKAILDATEELLADVGYAAMSLRALTGLAGVNLAAVHYHFGSKEELVKAVMRRRVAPINEVRLQELAAIEQQAAAAGTTPDPRALLRAFLGPAMLIARQDGGARACAMFGRLLAEIPPFLRQWMVEQFREVVSRFGDALQRAAPNVPAEEVLWRLHFLVGSMTHTMLHGSLLAAITEGRCGDEDHGEVLERLVTFGTAGMTAAATTPEETR